MQVSNIIIGEIRMSNRTKLSSKNNKKKGKNKYNEKDLYQQIADYILVTMTILYVFLMLVIYPLFYHNKYYDIGDTKYTFFKWVSLIFLLILIIGSIAWLYAYRREKNMKSIVGSISVSEWFAITFLIISMSSYFASSFQNIALWGYPGWNMGYVSQLIFVLIFLYVSRNWRNSEVVIIATVISAAIVYSIGILQRFSIDPLGMYINLGPEYIEKFISTLGQTTWYTSYTMLILPLGIYYFIYKENIKIRALAGIFTSLGFAMVCTTNSDSAYIALILILMVFFWYSFENNRIFVNYWEMVLIGFVTFRLIGIMQTLFPERMIQHIAETEAITEFIVHSQFMLVLLIIVFFITALVWYFFGRNDKSKTTELINGSVQKLKFLRYIMLGFAGMVIVFVIILIILTSSGQLPESLNRLYSVDLFVINDAWGNHRGFNWRMACVAISHASVKDLLIGVGPDCFAGAMNTYCAVEVHEYWQGMQLACAHNEFLNMLVTEGILGVLAYLGVFATMFWRLGKGAINNSKMVPYVAIVLAYVGHNFFCYQQCITTITVFILMGIGENLLRNSRLNVK